MSIILFILAVFLFKKVVSGLSARHRAVKASRKNYAIRKNYEYFSRSTAEYNRKAEGKRIAAHKKELEQKAKEEEKRRIPEEKQRKAEFNRQQAELDEQFLQSRLDAQYNEYWSIQEDIDILAGKIEIASDMHEIDKLRRHYKELDRLNKRKATVDNQIHATEKKLHSAQFKAGKTVRV